MHRKSTPSRRVSGTYTAKDSTLLIRSAFHLPSKSSAFPSIPWQRSSVGRAAAAASAMASNALGARIHSGIGSRAQAGWLSSP